MRGRMNFTGTRREDCDMDAVDIEINDGQVTGIDINSE
jgi:hypothetical protein